MVWYPVCVKVITVLKRTMFNATDSLDLVNVVLCAVLFIWMIVNPVSPTSHQCQFSPNNVISIHTQCSQENNYENY